MGQSISVLICKSHESLRYFVDYYRLITTTLKDILLLPHIDDLLNQFSGRKIYFRYWILANLSLKLLTRKTVFVTMDGQFDMLI